jgi:capsid protein
MTRQRRNSIGTIAEQFRDARNDYDAAKRTRFKRERTGIVRSGSASDYHYRLESDFFGMIEEARELFRNHALIGQGIRRLVANILSGGFTLDVRTGDKSLDADLLARWYDWADDADAVDVEGESNFNELERLTLQQTIVDGDVLNLPTDEGQIQQIEAHRLRTPSRTTRNIVHGVEKDDVRKRQAYWIAVEDNEQYYPVPKAGQMNRYEARDSAGNRQVLHHYFPDRKSQTRGVTAFAPAVDTAGMGDDLMFAQLVKAQMSAAITLLREMEKDAIPALGSNGLETTTETRPDGTTHTLSNWQPGLEVYGFPGEKLSGFSPNVPNAEFFDHCLLILRIVAVNLDLPIEVFLLDCSRTNFAGFRGALDQARARMMDIQRWLIRGFHTPIYRWKVRQWAAEDKALRRTIQEQEGKRLGPGSIDAFGHVWHVTGWPYLEPTADANGDLIQTRNMLISPRRAAARRGFEHQEIVIECVEDRGYTIDLAQKKANDLNAAHKADPGWVPLTWRDIAQPPPPEGVQISTGGAPDVANPTLPQEVPTNG